MTWKPNASKYLARSTVKWYTYDNVIRRYGLSEQQDRSRIMIFLFMGVACLALVGLSPFIVEHFAEDPLEITLTVSTEDGASPLNVKAQTLVSSETGQDQDIRWFLDGELKASGPKNVHQFTLSQEGAHLIKVEVTAGSQTASRTKTIRVTAPEAPQSESK